VRPCGAVPRHPSLLNVQATVTSTQLQAGPKKNKPFATGSEKRIISK